MTTIAYDGISVASDLQATCADMKAKAKKLYKIEDGSIVAITGDYSLSLALKDWYVAGREEGKCPCNRDKDNYGAIVVFRPNGEILHFENSKYPTPVLDDKRAWGSGRDFAMGAMAMGAPACLAVSYACQFDVYSGMGSECVILPFREE